MQELQQLILAVKEVAKMKYPSVENLLRKYGYNYEADCMDILVRRYDAFAKEIE